MNVKACESKKNERLTNFKILNLIYTKSIAKKFELDWKDSIVLIALANHYNPEKNIVFPSQEYIAEHFNISERSVIRAVKNLLLKGLILKSKRGLNNTYTFTNIFFEAIGQSPNTCPVVTQVGDQQSLKHDNIKYINNSYFQNFQKIEITESNQRIKATKKILQEKEQIKIGSPLDYSKEDAIKYIDSLLPELKNCYFARELKKKWNL